MLKRPTNEQLKPFMFMMSGSVFVLMSIYVAWSALVASGNLATIILLLIIGAGLGGYGYMQRSSYKKSGYKSIADLLSRKK